MHKLLLLLGVLALTAGCVGNAASTVAYENLPGEGDAANGEVLFNGANTNVTPCSGCHVKVAAAAPSLINYNDAVAASRVEGQTAREYTFYAIAEPAQHIVEGFGNAMPNNYDEHLSPQEIADLMAYLLVE